MEGKDGVFGVVFPGEHGGELLLLQHLGNFIGAFLEFRVFGNLFFFNGQLGHGQRILIQGFQLLISADFSLDLAGLLQHLLGIFRVVPEIGVGDPRLQLLQLPPQALDAQGLRQVFQLLLQAEKE